MFDNIFNELRNTTTAEEQSKIDGSKIHDCQKETKGDFFKRNPLGIREVGFTGKRNKDYEVLKKYHKTK